MAEQMSLLDQDIWSGKMFQAHCPQTKEKTLGASSKKRQGSSKKMFASLCLRGGGHTAEASFWNTEALLGASMMHSIGASHSGEKESVSWLTSTDLRQSGFCLTLNLSEQPRMANPTLLSEILVEDANPKYNLSPRACQGILNRANKRGKKLPEVLEQALKTQIGDTKTEPLNSTAPKESDNEQIS